MVARVCMLAGILLILCGLRRLKICPLDFGASKTKTKLLSYTD